MPFTDHLEELRWRLIRSSVAVVAMSTICFLFYRIIWNYVMSPLAKLTRYAKEKNIEVEIVTSKMQDDFLIQFKVALMVGILLAIPYLLFEVWSFFLPALYTMAKRVSSFLLLGSILLFWGGIFFARIYIWPLVNRFFLFEWIPPALSIGGGEFVYVKKYLNIPDYLSFFMSFHFAFGIAFQLPVVCILLALLQVIDTLFFKNFWKGAIVVIAMVSAILTPADVISMIALMVPLLLLFALSFLVVYFIEKIFSKPQKTNR